MDGYLALKSVHVLGVVLFVGGGPIPAEYWRLNRIWLGIGLVATVLPAANIYFMVFKPV